MRAMEDSLLPAARDKQKVLVLQGTGGIGKSQMAQEDASRHQDDYTAIFRQKEISMAVSHDLMIRG